MVSESVECYSMQDDDDKKWLTPLELSVILGVTIHTLQIWRQKKRFPDLKAVKMGKLIRYRRAIVDKFMESREY